MFRTLVATFLVGFALIFSGSVVVSDDAHAAKKTQRFALFSAKKKEAKKPRRIYRRRTVLPKYRRKEVRISTKEKPGTIIVDSRAKYLYLVTGKRKAIRYGIGVGREGFGWSGTVKLGRKKKWPSWTPPKEMVEREWRENKRRVSFMKGGPKNPLGARALYLYDGKRDTQFRIHGTNEPWSIGLNMSSGCIRMVNKDVEHLYKRASVGAKVVVIGPDGKGRRQVYSRFVNPIAALFD